jgi:hypothetical protein
LGAISRSAGGYGGGVYVTGSGTFKMNNGEISGDNTTSGGGVWVASTAATFTKEPAGSGSTSGVIYGYTANSAIGNLVGTRKPNKTPDTSHEAHKGDAVFYANGDKYRDSTLNAGDHISTPTGPWD